MATDSWWTSEGASLFALVRRFSTSNLEICSQSRADLRPSQSTRLLGTRRPPRRLAFNASSLRQARTSSYDLHTRWRHKCGSTLAVECPQNPMRKLECVGQLFI